MFLKSLKKYKFKTFLIFLSTTVSITSIFLIVSISNGIIDMYASMLKTDGDIIVIQKGVADTFFSDVDLKYKDKIEDIKGVKEVQGVIVGAGSIDVIPIVGIYGITKNRFKNYKLISGKYPQNNEIILGENISNILKNPKKVKLFNQEFKVTGIYTSEIGFENGGVLININDATKLFKKSSSFLLVTINNFENNSKILDKIKNLSEDIESKSTNEFIENYNQFKIIKISSLAISSISFFMGFLAIVSIMSIIINDRKYEFGIKRAIGISKKGIVTGVVLEALFITIISFIFALIISEGILEILKNIDKFQGYLNGKIDLEIIIYLFFGSSFMASLGAFIPAVIASNTDPIILIQRG